MPPSVVIRKAKRSDVSLILEYIGELAKFQNAADQVEATPELLEKNLVFDSNTSSAHAHCILATYDGKVGAVAYSYSTNSLLEWPYTSSISRKFSGKS